MSKKSDFMVKICYDGKTTIMDEICQTKKSDKKSSDSDIHQSKNPARKMITVKSSENDPECSKCLLRFASQIEIDLHIIENHDKLKTKVKTCDNSNNVSFKSLILLSSMTA